MARHRSFGKHSKWARSSNHRSARRRTRRDRRQRTLELLEPRCLLSWTVMYYGDFDNDIDSSAAAMFDNLKQYADASDATIVAQIDCRVTNEGAARRGVVHSSDTLGTLGQAISEPDTSDPRTLFNFIDFAKTTAHAEKYALILNDHGGGWNYGKDTQNAANSDAGGNGVFVTDIAAVLAGDEDGAEPVIVNGKREIKVDPDPEKATYIDVLVWEACLNQTIESAYELSDQVSFVVGSQAKSHHITGGVGAHHSFLGWITDATDPYTFASWFCLDRESDQHFDKTLSPCYDTLSIVDLGNAYKQLVSSVSTFVNSCVDSANRWRGDTEDFKAIQTARQNSYLYGAGEGDAKKAGIEWRDLANFAQSIANNISVSQPIRDAASGIFTSVNAVVKANWDDPPDTRGNGLSISFAGGKPGYWGWQYSGFFDKAGWDRFAMKLEGEAGTNLHDSFSLVDDGKLRIDSYSDPERTDLVSTRTVDLEAGIALSLVGGEGNDVFDFSGTNWDLPAVIVDGGSSSDTLIGPDRDNTWTIDADVPGQLDTKDGSEPELEFSGIDVVDGGSEADYFRINGTDSELTVKGRAGSDTFCLGYSGWSLDTISAPVNVNGGGGNDVLRLWDDNDPDANQYAITAATVTRGSKNIGYSGIEKIDIDAGAGANTFHVGNGSWDGVAATIDVDGNGGSDQLVVVGTGTTDGRYTPSGTTTGDGTVTVSAAGETISSIHFSDLEPVTVSGMANWTFATPNSSDDITVDSPAPGRNRIRGTSGGVAFEELTFFSVTSFTVDLATNDGALPNDSLSIDPPGLVATGLNTFTVNGGDGNDRFSVRPSTSATINVNGGPPVVGDPGVPPGDILAVDLIDASRPYVPRNVTSGAITSSTHQAVNFTSIETLIASDRFEVNDTQVQATVLGSDLFVTLRDLSIHSPEDVDFFKITAHDTGKLVINALFLEAVGDLDLKVRDANGNAIAQSASGTDNERLVIPVVAQETYYLEVFGFDGDINNYALEIENFPAPIPSGGFFDPASDTGRSDADNITYNSRPQMFIYADVLNFVDTNHNDTRDAGEIAALTAAQATAGTTPGAAVQVWLTNTTTRTTVKGYADPLDAGNPFLYSFTPATVLPDGTYVVTAATWIFDGQGDSEGAPSPASARTLLSAPLLQFTVDTVAPPVSFIGIDPASSDTGVSGHPATFADRITSDTAPGFVGHSEADAIVGLYEKSNLSGAAAITVAVPLDGQGPFGGQWRTSYVYDLNDPAFFPMDGLRTMEARAMDVAGNVSEPATLEIFIDTQGPRVTAVKIRDDWATAYDESTYDLFNPKGTPGGHRPTPLVTSLDIDVSDLPVRVTDFLYGALVDGDPTLDRGNYLLRGDANGVIPIADVLFDGVAPANCQPATGTIRLIFFEPLPDDRFTLTISDELVDRAGNKLDGETNAIEPQDDPSLPSGDGVPGGDFIARFTVDSRPEIGVWSAGSVYVDTNGNFYFDPENPDDTNEDLVYVLGYTSDYVFAGNFAQNSTDVADGFGAKRAADPAYPDSVATLDHAFSPYPLGQDLFAQFGDEFAVPVVGNFDPPVAGRTATMDNAFVGLLGTPGDDVLEFRARSTPGSWTVTLNGVAQNYVSGSSLSLEFDGLGGQDTVIVVGNTGKEIAQLSPGRGTISGEDYLVTVANVESIRVDGGGGTDVAYLRGDPEGNDTFQADPDGAALSGDGYSNEVIGFRYVHAYGDVGDNDVAFLHDDPNQSDVFQAWPEMARLYGAGYYNRVKSFRWVHAYATPGNKDVAFLHDDPNQDDTFQAWPEMARLYGAGYYHRVKSFGYVHAYGTPGNNDVAYLRDSAGNDVFQAWPQMARLYGAGFYNRVKSFRWVHGYSSEGTDMAQLYGSGGNDTFVAYPGSSRLYGSGYYNRAVAFDKVEARGAGGSDVARLHDAALETGLTVPAEAGMVVWLYEFDEIRQHDDQTGKESVTDAVDKLFTAYWQ